MKILEAYVETVKDLSSSTVKVQNAFIETVANIKDENSLRIKDVFVECIIDHYIGQSVS